MIFTIATLILVAIFFDKIKPRALHLSLDEVN